MIPNIKTHEVLVGGVGETRAFTMEANAVAFRAVTAKLYSNPIDAVIRELSTNARDSHVEFGTPDRPFDVGLPTDLNPTFTVRDYGISMTHELVMDLYSKLFGSSKRHTNELAGGWGLGRMSAMAISDSFYIACYLDGEERVYSIFLDQQGVPNVALMHRGPTTEERGFLVTVPVELEDIRKFQEAAQVTLMGFKPRPNLNVTWNHPEPKLSGKGWDYYPGLGKSYACMGNVMYPVDGYEVYAFNSTTGLVMTFGIGELSVSTSRESLNYDKPTKEALKSRIETIKQEVHDTVGAHIEGADTYLDACDRYHEAYKRLGSTWMSYSHKWRGTPVRENPYIDSQLGVLIDSSTNLDGLKFRLASGRRDQRRSTEHIRDALFLFEGNDVSRAASRIRNYFKTHQRPRLVYWSRNKLEGIDYVDLSTIEPEPVVRKPRSPSAPRREGMSMRIVTAGHNSRRFQQITLVPDNDFVFIKAESVNRIEVQPGKFLYDQESLARQINEICQVGVLPYGTVIALMPEALEARLKKAGVRVRLLHEVIRDHLVAKYDVKKVYPYDTYASARGKADVLLRALRAYEGTLGRDLTRFVKRVEAISRLLPHTIRSLIISYCADLHSTVDPWGEGNPWDEIVKKCPLLTEIGSSHYTYYLKLEGKLK